MSVSHRSLFTCLVLLAPLTLHAQELCKSQGLETARRQQVRDACRDLAREVAYLQEDIAADLIGEQARLLYREANNVLGGLVELQTALQANGSVSTLNGTCQCVEQKVQSLVQQVRKLGPEYRLLQRDAVRVAEAGDGLRHTAVKLETTGTHTRAVLTREARRLAVAARQLNTVAEALLDPPVASRVLLVDIEKLAQTADRFASRECHARDLGEVKELFRPVNDAWKQVILRLRVLPPLDQVLLFRTAIRVSELEDQVRDLLGVEKELPTLLP